MIPKEWVLPIPSEIKEYVIRIPYGLFYEELVYGALAELSEQAIQDADEDEQHRVRDAFLRIIDSIVVLNSPPGGIMLGAARRTVVSVAENLPPATWVNIVPTHAAGAATLSGDGVALPAGTWLVRWSIYARQGTQCESRLTKNGVEVGRGVMGFAGTISGAPSVTLTGSAVVDVTPSDILTLQAWFRVGGSLAAPTNTESNAHTCMVIDFVGIE